MQRQNFDRFDSEGVEPFSAQTDESSRREGAGLRFEPIGRHSEHSWRVAIVAGICAAVLMAPAPASAWDTPELTLLRAFSHSGRGGAIPGAGLIADGAGNLYGTTTQGGGRGCLGPRRGGCGTVFKLAPDGTGFTVLHLFGDDDNDERFPAPGLVADSAGNLYGTTRQGGGKTRCDNFVAETVGCGDVFKLASDGTGFTVLHTFRGGTIPFRAAATELNP